MYEKHEIYDKLVPFIFHRDVITKDFKDIDETHIVQTEAARMALEYIDENFSEDISIDDLSEYVGYSKAYLSRQFKKRLRLCLLLSI